MMLVDITVWFGLIEEEHSQMMAYFILQVMMYTCVIMQSAGIVTVSSKNAICLIIVAL